METRRGWTRRALGALAGSVAAAAPAAVTASPSLEAAQATASPSGVSNPDLEAARQAIKRNAKSLAEAPLTPADEPAFRFEA